MLSEITLRVAADERVLITTLTKRMSEDLTEYLHEHGVKVRYLHSDVETVERVEIIRDLRLGKFDVLVGINLLREGLDMPCFSLLDFTYVLLSNQPSIHIVGLHTIPTRQD